LDGSCEGRWLDGADVQHADALSTLLEVFGTADVDSNELTRYSGRHVQAPEESEKEQEMDNNEEEKAVTVLERS
jgi:hypothetical protein